jgi:predicted MPP superfamily phosphohydrolase
MCKKPAGIRRAVGRGKGFSKLRGINESLLKPVWERFPLEKYADRLIAAPERTTHAVTLPHYAGRPLRLAFLSDLHAGPTTPHKTLDAAFGAVHEARPDLVLLGGDYVYLDADNIDCIAHCLRELASTFPVFGVWGNHDLWADDHYLERFLSGQGVRMLCNEWEKGLLGEPVDLYGVDDPWTGEPDFSPLLDADRPVVLLCHNPDGILLMDERHRADLMLCGHTHGGQICRPDGSPYMVHAKTGTRFAGGHYRHEQKQIVVSRGVGTVEIPLRLYAPPEVLIVDLVGAGATAPAHANLL